MKKNTKEIESNRFNANQFFKESGSIKVGFKLQTRILSDNSGNLITEEKQIVNPRWIYISTLSEPFQRVFALTLKPTSRGRQ